MMKIPQLFFHTLIMLSLILSFDSNTLMARSSHHKPRTAGRNNPLSISKENEPFVPFDSLHSLRTGREPRRRPVVSKAFCRIEPEHGVRVEGYERSLPSNQPKGFPRGERTKFCKKKSTPSENRVICVSPAPTITNTYTVTLATDTGAVGELRWAINQSNDLDFWSTGELAGEVNGWAIQATQLIPAAA